MLVESYLETGPLLPGHKLLFPSPDCIPSLIAKQTEPEILVPTKFDPKTILKKLEIFSKEYAAILDTLTSVVDRDDLRLIQESSHARYAQQIGHPTPDFGLKMIVFEAKDIHPMLWLRDGFTTVGDFAFVNPKYFRYIPQSSKIIHSKFAEGGLVLNTGNAVLVSEELWKKPRADRAFHLLKETGFRIGSLPLVDTIKQENGFPPNHIDGHAALITSREGKPTLLAARSYLLQGGQTYKLVRRAAETVGAQLIQVDDRNLPPLALNLIQFMNREVVVTATDYADFNQLLVELLGPEKVHSTRISISEIPQNWLGSIRCMTTTLPYSLLQQLAA